MRNERDAADALRYALWAPSAGALWLRGACRPWAAGYYCQTDLYWHFEDEPITPACVFCGEPMASYTDRQAALLRPKTSSYHSQRHVIESYGDD